MKMNIIKKLSGLFRCSSRHVSEPDEVDTYYDLITDDPVELAAWYASSMAAYAAQRRGGMGGIAGIGKDKDALGYQRYEKMLRKLVSSLSANDG